MRRPPCMDIISEVCTSVRGDLEQREARWVRGCSAEPSARCCPARRQPLSQVRRYRRRQRVRTPQLRQQLISLQETSEKAVNVFSFLFFPVKSEQTGARFSREQSSHPTATSSSAPLFRAASATSFELRCCCRPTARCSERRQNCSDCLKRCPVRSTSCSLTSFPDVR